MATSWEAFNTSQNSDRLTGIGKLQGRVRTISKISPWLHLYIKTGPGLAWGITIRGYDESHTNQEWSEPCRLCFQFFLRKVREGGLRIIKLNLQEMCFGGKKCTDLTLKRNFLATKCVGLKNDCKNLWEKSLWGLVNMLMLSGWEPAWVQIERVFRRNSVTVTTFCTSTEALADTGAEMCFKSVLWPWLQDWNLVWDDWRSTLMDYIISHFLVKAGLHVVLMTLLGHVQGP